MRLGVNNKQLSSYPADLGYDLYGMQTYGMRWEIKRNDVVLLPTFTAVLRAKTVNV